MEAWDHQTLFMLGLLGVGGMLLGELLHKFRIPAISGYLALGLILGPAVAGVITPAQLEAVAPLNHLALGLIALTVGLEFEWHHVRELGLSIALLAFIAAIGAMILVAVALGLYTGNWPLALVLGAIATATAPAATFLTIAEYRAAGPLCSTTKMVVAVDDAIGIIIFALTVTAAELLSPGERAASSIRHELLLALWELFGSLLVGLVLGFAGSRLNRALDRWAVPMLLASVLLVVGLARELHLSALLTCMAFGAVIVNTNPKATRQLEGLEPAFNIVYVIFFALAGASLHVSTLMQVGLVGVIYILARAAGKLGGAALGGVLTKQPPQVVRYLGLALMPQAGVAVGMAMIAHHRMPDLGKQLSSIVLGGVFVFEVIGPFLTRIAIFRSGEAYKATRSEIRVATDGPSASAQPSKENAT